MPRIDPCSPRSHRTRCTSRRPSGLGGHHPQGSRIPPVRTGWFVARSGVREDARLWAERPVAHTRVRDTRGTRAGLGTPGQPCSDAQGCTGCSPIRGSMWCTPGRQSLGRQVLGGEEILADCVVRNERERVRRRERVERVPVGPSALGRSVEPHTHTLQHFRVLRR